MTRTTIVMQFRNAIKFTSEAIVREALDSVKAQTVPTDKIAINSLSEDDTQKIFEEYGFRILHSNTINSGKTLNMGIEAALTPYVMPFCPDDVLMPTYVEKAEKVLENNEIDATGGHIERIGAESGTWINEGVGETIFSRNTTFFTSLIRKQTWEKLGRFDEHIPHDTMEDWEFWMRFHLSKKKYQVIDEVMYQWRKHDNNISHFHKDHMTEIYAYYKQKLGL